MSTASVITADTFGKFGMPGITIPAAQESSRTRPKWVSIIFFIPSKRSESRDLFNYIKVPRLRSLCSLRSGQVHLTVHVMDAAAEMPVPVIGIVIGGVFRLLAGDGDLQHAVARGIAFGFEAVVIDTGIVVGLHLGFFRGLNFLRRSAGAKQQRKAGTQFPFDIFFLHAAKIGVLE